MLIHIGENVPSRGVVFIGLIFLSASAFILAILIGEVIVSNFKK
jgi:hypothetical protein